MKQRNLGYKKYYYANRITPPPLYSLYSRDQWEFNVEASNSGKTFRLSLFGLVCACQLTKDKDDLFYTLQYSLSIFSSIKYVTYCVFNKTDFSRTGKFKNRSHSDTTRSFTFDDTFNLFIFKTINFLRGFF
jgi:hypothetical protein